MTGIGDKLDAEWDAFRSHLPGHHTAPAAVPTFTPAKPSQPEVPVSVLGTIHKDLSAIGSAAQHAWPQLTAIVTNPLLDELVEAALTAAGAGADAAVFEAAIDSFNGAVKRKAGAVDQVADAVDAGQQAATPQVVM